MRNLFENGTIRNVEINNHIISMLPNKCFLVTELKTGYKVLESSSTESYNWVRNYTENLQSFQK